MLFQIGLNIMSSIKRGIIIKPNAHIRGSMIYSNSINIDHNITNPMLLILKRMLMRFSNANINTTPTRMNPKVALIFDSLLGSFKPAILIAIRAIINSATNKTI
jgi:hypothetical protein